MRRIIDVHTHLSERPDDALNRFARMNGLRYTIDELLETMRRQRIDRSLLLSPPLEGSFTPLPNNEVIRLCNESKGKLLPVITVEPSSKDVGSAIRLAEEHRREVKAFKIRLGYVEANADSPVFDELYDYAQSRKLPILFHTGDTASSTGSLASAHPLTLDGLANKRQELTIVLCHFGNPWFEDVAELIYKHPNVYTDISGLVTGHSQYAREYAKWLSKKITEAIYYAGGAEKIMFGTDYPITKHTEALVLVKALKVEERDKERILGRNAEHVFKL